MTGSIVLHKPRALGPTGLERWIERLLADTPTGDGSAAVAAAPVTSDQVEYEWIRWRGWRRLVGGEAFFFSCPGKFAKAAIRQEAAQ